MPRRGVSVPRGYTKASRLDPCVKAHNCFLLKCPSCFFVFFCHQDSCMLMRIAPLLSVTAGPCCENRFLKLFLTSRPLHEHRRQLQKYCLNDLTLNNQPWITDSSIRVSLRNTKQQGRVTVTKQERRGC